jgi:thiosulfate/3-mercaptopyruvate sulfurtransferase
MKKLIILICFTLSGLIANAQDAMSILVTPQWLKEHLHDADVVPVQVNFFRLDYEKEHIEGARFLWPEWLAPNSPEGSFNTPEVAKATEVLRAMGVNNNSRIVLYHVRNEVSITARMFLTLEHLGLRGKVSFLNGGLEEWKKEGNAVTSVVPVVKPGKVTLKQGDLLVSKDYVLKTLQSDKGLVVDARAKNWYDGDATGNPRDGHIAGAKNIYFAEMIDTSNKFKPTDSLKGYFVPVATPEKELVTYCFIGQTASVIYMAGRILGYEMKLYDGSMQEWSRVESLPMEKTKP